MSLESETLQIFIYYVSGSIYINQEFLMWELVFRESSSLLMFYGSNEKHWSNYGDLSSAGAFKNQQVWASGLMEKKMEIQRQ